VVVGHSRGDYQVDISSKESIVKMYKSIGKFDALVCASGSVHFGKLAKMSDALYRLGIDNKLMGQVNLVLKGMNFINDAGSFTLTSGILSQEPIMTGSSGSMINGAIDAFAKSAAIEMPRGIRINSVSPTVILEAMEKYGPYFRGFNPVPVAKAALAYSKSVEGMQTGQTYTVLY
jgi:NAD(P)-dependent dehydrogenase (short-subunit alcohol dehydrogenase family)